MNRDAPDAAAGESVVARARLDLTNIAIRAALSTVLVAVAVRRGLPLANADSLLYGLISTEHLTPYYWGQNRLANIVPAIAWPVQQVRWNHLLQSCIIAVSFFGLVASFVRFHAARALRPPSPTAITVSWFLTGALALALLNRWGTYTFVVEQQYALSTLLFLAGVGGLSAGSTRAQILGLIGMTAGALVIPSSVLLFPAVLLMRPRAGAVRRLALAGGASVFAFAVNTLAADLLADDYPGSDAYTDFSISRMRTGFPHVVASIWDSVHGVAAIVVGFACAGVLVARRRSLTAPLVGAYACCPVVALTWIALFSANAWVEQNSFVFRYFFVAYASGLLVLAGAVTESCAWVAERAAAHAGVLAGRIDARFAAGAGALAVAAGIAVIVSTDVPAIDRGHELSTIAIERDVDVVVGDYWQAWPAMFAARSRGADLFAASARTEAIRGRILALADAGPIGALCIGGDVPTCVAELDITTRAAWEATRVVSTQPLVVEMARLD